MAVSYQLVVDCASPPLLAHFWAEALGYVVAPPPSGFCSWDDYLGSLGVPAAQLGRGTDRIEDPRGEGPRIWFQVVPEGKTGKNRLHLDVFASHAGDFRGDGSPEVRHGLIETEVARLVSLGATRLSPVEDPGPEPSAVAMADPEGNEFDVN
jgi:hypothetical protein